MTMSKLREKSNSNIAAAKVLLDINLYAPSVHCSYYSCFQLCKYIISHSFNIDYKTQEQTIVNSKPHQGTHQYVINFISNKLNSSTQEYYWKKFKRDIKDLKNYRIESDYLDIEVHYDKSNKAYRLSQEIRDSLKKTFKV